MTGSGFKLAVRAALLALPLLASGCNSVQASGGAVYPSEDDAIAASAVLDANCPAAYKLKITKRDDFRIVEACGQRLMYFVHGWCKDSMCCDLVSRVPITSAPPERTAP